MSFFKSIVSLLSNVVPLSCYYSHCLNDYVRKCPECSVLGKWAMFRLMKRFSCLELRECTGRTILCVRDRRSVSGWWGNGSSLGSRRFVLASAPFFDTMQTVDQTCGPRALDGPQAMPKGPASEVYSTFLFFMLYCCKFEAFLITFLFTFE
jgi:hypothetical protein